MSPKPDHSNRSVSCPLVGNALTLGITKDSYTFAQFLRMIQPASVSIQTGRQRVYIDVYFSATAVIVFPVLVVSPPSRLHFLCILSGWTTLQKVWSLEQRECRTSLCNLVSPFSWLPGLSLHCYQICREIGFRNRHHHLRFQSNGKSSFYQGLQNQHFHWTLLLYRSSIELIRTQLEKSPRLYSDCYNGTVFPRTWVKNECRRPNYIMPSSANAQVLGFAQFCTRNCTQWLATKILDSSIPPSILYIGSMNLHHTYQGCQLTKEVHLGQRLKSHKRQFP